VVIPMDRQPALSRLVRRFMPQDLVLS